MEDFHFQNGLLTSTCHERSAAGTLRSSVRARKRRKVVFEAGNLCRHAFIQPKTPLRLLIPPRLLGTCVPSRGVNSSQDMPHSFAGVTERLAFRNPCHGAHKSRKDLSFSRNGLRLNLQGGLRLTPLIPKPAEAGIVLASTQNYASRCNCWLSSQRRYENSRSACVNESWIMVRINFADHHRVFYSRHRERVLAGSKSLPC